MQYDHTQIEEKWCKQWQADKTYRVENDPSKPKYYVLDMFPYPSGAGLHVGHPLGYIASDIVARFKRHNGFNVLHPMGYDSFGLPAEQYAIQTGQHPAETTKTNIEGGTDKSGNVIPGYRKQLDGMGFSFDWSREVRTSDPNYYKWTQWIFLQLFDSWYDKEQDKARPIADLIARFESKGCQGQDAEVLTGDVEEALGPFTAHEWQQFNERTRQRVLQHFRLAYLSDAWVNWCPALGTVLANDEVKDGVSERGGHPVERKRMPQWSMRITAYAQRLLDGLDALDWSTSLKEAQRNWIGRSEGAVVRFALAPSGSPKEGSPTPNPSPKKGYLTPNPSPKERGVEPGAGAFSRSIALDKEGKIPGAEKPFYRSADRATEAKLMGFARDMRKAPTESEDKLWQLIRGNATGVRIRRQHVIDRFIVDFVSLSKQLVIEVDGDIHASQSDEDEGRTERLNELGFEVIRFTNDQVKTDPFLVLDQIKAALEKRPDYRDAPDDNVTLSLGEGMGEVIEVFTTRPDTLFGVTFLTLAPEHDLVASLTTQAQRIEVETYVKIASNRSERERQTEVEKVSGVFTGSYAKHPFTGADIPVWVGDYVLAGYGTGAVMAVPGGDQRDWRFARHFKLPIIPVTEGADITKGADESKDATICSEGILRGLKVPDAIRRSIQELEKLGAGEGRINYRLRDAAFGRQRYWGEPIPIYYKDDIPHPLPESALPLVLPEVDKFQPTESGEPPLARAKKWAWDETTQQVVETSNGLPLETTTMPGWAGSSWYFLRYMDPHNEGRFASPEAIKYWGQIDLYMGGSEHATGHLLYFRFWTKFLHDRGWLPFDEPAKKLVNQGMIQGVSAFLSPMGHVSWQVKSGEIIVKGGARDFVSKETSGLEDEVHFEWLKDRLLTKVEKEIVGDISNSNWSYEGVGPLLAVPVSMVNERNELDIDEFKRWSSVHYGNLNLHIGIDGKFRCERMIEKMSKSKFNVVNPDEIISKYGADTLRLYEMFLGPVEQSKPWDTNGIEGTFRFLRKFWNLFYKNDALNVSDEAPTKAEFKTLHTTLKKVTEDIENMSFNTSVSQFMIAVNELGALKCHKRDVLEPLTIALAPFAPHIAEELWHLLGHRTSVTLAPWPKFDEKHLVEDNFNYPISFNGKTRMLMEFPIALTKEEVEAQVLADPEVQERLEGKAPKKVIVVHKRIVNIVV